MPPRKKKADEPKGEPESKQAKGSDLQKMISGSKLKSLLKSKRAAQADTSEINGNLGSEIKNAIQNDNLHRGAFTLIARLDRMEPEALRNFMDNFEYLYDASGLQKRAESVQRLPIDDADADGEYDDETGDRKVARFPAAQAAAE